MRRACSLLALALALFPACKKDSDNTKIVVAVWSDLAVPGELDSVRIEVAGPTEIGTRTFQLATSNEAGRYQLPIELQLVPLGDKSASFTVKASGLRNLGEVVAQTARVSFVSGQALLLKLFLGRACVGMTCAGDTTCAQGACDQPIVVPSLPLYTPGNVLPPDGGPRLDSGSGPDLPGGESNASEAGTTGRDGPSGTGGVGGRGVGGTTGSGGATAVDAPFGGAGGAVRDGGSGGRPGTGGRTGGSAGAGGATGQGGAVGTDADAVAADKAWLAITFAEGDSASSVTSAVILPTAGPNGSTIGWTSDYPAIVSPSGAVARPATTTTVQLTATLRKGAATDTKVFTVKVMVSDAALVAMDKADLQVGFTGDDTARSVTQNLVLATTGAAGSTIVWDSSPPSIVSSSGVVTRQSHTTAVTLTATLSKGSASDTKKFVVYVVGTAADLGFLYAAGNGVSAFRINADGSLTAVPGSPFGTEYLTVVTMAPANRFLYALGSGLRAYSVNPDGALSPISGSPVAAESGANSIAVNPAGTFAYVTNGYPSDAVSVYSVGASGLPVSIGAPVSVAPESDPTSCVVSPSGQYLYVADSNSTGTGKVAAYSIGADGSLSLIGSPILGDQANCGNAVAITPSGKYVYMSNLGTISAYSTNADGSLTSLSTYGDMFDGNTNGIVIDPAGKFLYVIADWDGQVISYRINADGSLFGKVTTQVTSGLTQDTASIAIDRSGRYAYVSVPSANTIALFSIDATNGSLAPLSPSTMASSSPRSLSATH